MSYFCACSFELARRVGSHSSLLLQPGVVTLLVKFPAVLAKEYPIHVKNTTFYGRLISDKAILNLDISLGFDEEVRHVRRIMVCSGVTRLSLSVAERGLCCKGRCS